MRCLSAFLATFCGSPGFKHKNTDSAKPATKTVDAARSLVCGDCWDGLFARETFQDLLENRARWFYDPTMRSFSYNSTYNAIDASRRSGCNWCSFLLSSFTLPDADAGPFPIRVAFGPPEYDHAGGVLLSAQFVHVQVNDHDLLTFPIYTLADDPCADEIVARERIRRMRSTETCRLALGYLSYCIDNHHGCPKPAQDRVLPTRVIDCTDPQSPRLFITAGNVRGSYVVLSYVWGEDQPNKTKQHNVDAYAHGIDVDLLPQTAKDAIWVTHTCGEKCLWIDALCIIQDSKQDKRREIAKIPAIFAEASFTIIAARSSKASEGFLHDCPPPSVPIHRLPFPCGDDPSHFGTVYVEQDTHNGYDDACDVNDPVHKRAWCLEELMLSTRALVYTSNTLRFHCRTMRVNVGDAVRRPSDLPARRITIDWMPEDDPELEESESDSDSLFRSMILWDNIVRNYTTRTVTQIEDKLIAIAGVAVRFGARWKNGTYLAGLWLDNLQHDLLWHTTDSAQLPRPGVYRAPSWSWASVDGPVEPIRLSAPFRMLYQLKGHGMTLASDQLPFGAVTGGYLTLAARLLKATWRDDGLYTFPPQVSSSAFGEDDAGPQPETQIHGACRDAIGPCGPDVWLLPVCWVPDEHELLGLVVISAGSPTEYRRVGFFNDFPLPPRSKDWNIEELSLQNITLV